MGVKVSEQHACHEVDQHTGQQAHEYGYGGFHADPHDECMCREAIRCAGSNDNISCGSEASKRPEGPTSRHQVEPEASLSASSFAWSSASRPVGWSRASVP